MCLQPQKYNVRSFSAWYITGVNAVSLCEPSQNGWLALLPHAHQKYFLPACTSTGYGAFCAMLRCCHVRTPIVENRFRRCHSNVRFFPPRDRTRVSLWTPCRGNVPGVFRGTLRRLRAHPASGRCSTRRANRACALPSDDRRRASSTSFGGSATPRSPTCCRRFRARCRARSPTVGPSDGCCARVRPRALRRPRNTRPEYAHSSAWLMPTTRGRNQLEHASGTMPRRANTKPKRATSAARRMSIASVIVTPMPTAGPFTAAMTGFLLSKIRSVSSPPPSRLSPFGRSARASALNVAPPAPRSAPAQNARPGAGHDDRANRIVGIGAIERVDHLGHHRAGERVQLFRTVHRDREYAVVDVVQDFLITHAILTGGAEAGALCCPDCPRIFQRLTVRNVARGRCLVSPREPRHTISRFFRTATARTHGWI